MIKGKCNCGTVTFEVHADVTDLYVCHCSICRKWTGNNGVAVLVCPNEAFQWITGQAQVRTWQKPDADWMSAFCEVCGSALPGPNDEDRMFVPAGLLDGPGDTLRVPAHIWVDSKAAWDEIGDSGDQYPRAYGEQ